MAFVIIQHLDPTHKGSCPNSSSVPPPWRLSGQGPMKVKPNCVYVIPQ